MPSFDIVNEIEEQEVDNAVNQTAREISTRFDFKGGISSIEFDKVQTKIKIMADDDMKLRAIHQILEAKMAKRGLDCRLLDYEKEEAASGRAIRQMVKIKKGLTKEEGKDLIKRIKDAKLKVQAQLQDEQVRVTGKKIDDLQEVIALLKAANLPTPLQFVNMRS
jgi:uncharacterized protein YajQ (UPF0234 family)